MILTKSRIYEKNITSSFLDEIELKRILLLDFHNPNSTGRELRYACYCNYKDLIYYFLSHGEKITGFIYERIIRFGHLDLIDFIINRKELGLHTKSLFPLAIKYKHYHIVDYCNIDVSTALKMTEFSNDIKILQYYKARKRGIN